MSEETVIHKIQIFGGSRKGMQNMQTIIQNKPYFTTIYIAKNWYQNENGYADRPWDTEKSPQ